MYLTLELPLPNLPLSDELRILSLLDFKLEDQLLKLRVHPHGQSRRIKQVNRVIEKVVLAW